MIKKGFFFAVIGLVSAATIFFVGYGMGRSEVRRAQTDLGQAQKETRLVQFRLVAFREMNCMQSARGFLYEAAVQLDRRNFGACQSEIGHAGAALRRSTPGAAGVDARAVAALAQEIGSGTVRIRTDIGAQRDQILGYAGRLNALLAPQMQPSGAS